MSASRSAQLSPSETELSLWLVLDYGTVCHAHDIVASDTLSQFRREFKAFYLDSHILLFCFSFFFVVLAVFT